MVIVYVLVTVRADVKDEVLAEFGKLFSLPARNKRAVSPSVFLSIYELEPEPVSPV